MKHDLVIRGGWLADGLGGEPLEGDLAIDGETISAIGEVSGSGAQEIDARGCVVSPGFIDLHTHLDAQIGWDPELTPVSWHGVTTALIGNCGVTFAPCRASDREALAAMMETVEDIPRQAILSGLPWSWEDYGGYLEALDALRPGVNVAGLVGHVAVRTYVMGERAHDTATPADVQEMAAVVGRSMDRGAVGFSTNRYEPHKGPDGRSIPGTFADPEELYIIGREVGSRKGLMQAVGAGQDVLKGLSESGSRVLFSWGLSSEKGSGRASAGVLEQICEGRDMTAITQVRGTGYMFGLQAGLPFRGEAWDQLRAMPFDARVKAIKDPAFAARLAEGEWAIGQSLNNVYYLGAEGSPNHTAEREDNVVKACKASGERFEAMFVRLSQETDGRALFNLRMFCQDLHELGDLFRSPHILPSLGDAGAHVSQIMDADWSTFILSYWVRQRKHFTMGEAIRKMTSDPARVLRLRDRGVLAVGKKADVAVFNPDTVQSLQPHIVRDFPGNAPRYIQRARGYKATVVNGRVNVLDDNLLGSRAGRVLRHAA